MLYIFWVEKGSIITLHVDVAVDTVNNLKAVLAQSTGISEASQVLLINGGESLRDGSRVAKYQSGTDTNPIFLFNRDAIESDRLPDLTSDAFAPVPDEVEAKESLEAVLNLPPNFNSIVSRTQLAQQYHDYAKELNRQCSVLVQEQHLQHQGWQAVMANLDDVVSAFKKRLAKFQVTFESYLSIRSEKLQDLLSFNEHLDVLSRIPLFPSLIRASQTGSAQVEENVSVGDDPEGLADKRSSSTEEVTILDWISAKDADHSLQTVAEGCRRTMETFDDTTLEDVVKESRAVMDFCNNSMMREIKGLGERLSGLDQLLADAKKQVLEQKETADMLYKMQQQASSSREPQMFKELAASFAQLLQQMVKCHKKLFDIKKRCLAAKQELCSHLHVRLKWVISVENGITEVDDKIKIYYENIKRIKRLTHMLDQVRESPRVYVSAVEEVLRRRHYANDFTHWADTVSKTAMEAYSRESDLRKSFLSLHASHFLLTLFPGLDQFPPQFATSPPGQFDSSLPLMTEADLASLLQRIPHIDVPAKNDLHMLKPCPLTCQSSDAVKTVAGQRPAACQRRVSFHEDEHVVMEETGLPQCTLAERKLLDDLPKILSAARSVFILLRAGQLKSRQDLLSMADTMRKMMRDTLPQLLEQFHAQLAKKNAALAETVAHHQKLYDEVVTARDVIAVHIAAREEELTQLKLRLESEIAEHRQCGEKKLSYQELLRLEQEEREKARVAAEKNAAEKEQEIIELRAAVLAAIEDGNRRIQQLQAENDEKMQEKEREMLARLTREKEVLALELGQNHYNHLQEQQSVWEERHQRELAEALAVKDEETSRQMQKMKYDLESELSIQKELLQSQSERKLSRPPSVRSGDMSPQLEEPSALLRKDSAYLSCKSLSLPEPDSPRLQEMEMSTSSFPMDASYMAVSSSHQPSLDAPIPLSPRPRNLSTGPQNYITISSCNMGELVLFVYNKEFKQYTAYLPFKRSLYLLHSDSHVDLSLSVPDHDGALVDVRSWVVAEIVGKEYVLTKKVPNRYRLQVGTKFYRVKAKSWDLENMLKEANLNSRPSEANLSISTASDVSQVALAPT